MNKSDEVFNGGPKQDSKNIDYIEKIDNILYIGKDADKADNIYESECSSYKHRDSTGVYIFAPMKKASKVYNDRNEKIIIYLYEFEDECSTRTLFGVSEFHLI